MRRPADRRIAAPGGLSAETANEPRRSPTKPPASSPPPNARGRPKARCASGASVSDDERDAHALRAPATDLSRKKAPPAEHEERERRDERGEAEELEAAVRERGAESPRPVAWPEPLVVHGREERGVVRVIRDERREQKEARGDEEDSEKLVAPPHETPTEEARS